MLNLASDGKEHRLRDAAEFIADFLHLSDADRKETTSSGNKRYRNRTGWARTHLSKAGLLVVPRRGYFKITDRGQDLLNDNPPEIIDHKFLVSRYGKAYLDEWKSPSNNHPEDTTDNESSNDESPEDRIESIHSAMQEALANDILNLIKELPPSFFEDLVVKLLVKMGYGGSLKDAGEAIGGSGDEGIDGIIKEDKLGLDTIYIQAKRYNEASVGRPAIQAFAGALQGARAKKGVFLTTSTYAKPALDYVKNIDSKIVLIDGIGLANYMIEFGLGVYTVNTYEVKQIDSDFFSEE